MTPQEKAEELVHKFKPFVQFKMGVEQSYVLKMAKECALIAVDNSMDALRFLPYGLDYLQQIDYWEGVKIEIEKL